MNLYSAKIADLGKIVTGKTPSTKNKDNFGGNIPFITPVDMTYNRNVFSTERYVSSKGAESVKGCVLPPKTICVSCIGSDMGKSVITTKTSITNQQINSIIVYEEYNYMYVYYLMRTLESTIKSLGKNGTAVPILSKSKFSDIEIKVHDFESQYRIADILSTYDDLIENNQKQIKLLEEAAQRLYKEWFVDLRFPGYENVPVVGGVPEGWRNLPLGELIKYEIGGGWGEDQPTEKCDQPAYVIRGTDLYDVTHGNSKSIPYRYHAQSNLNSRKLQDGDIIFEVSGGSKNEGVARTALITESLIDFLGGDVICASFCKLIRFKDKSLAKYMYDTLQYLRNSGETVKYDKRSASSIVNYRWKDFLEQQFIFVPTIDILTQYNALAEKMQNAIVNKAQIIERAKQVRDRLLPKLMNGEIEV